MECQHYYGSTCVFCKERTNSCCYDDRSCDKCNAEICDSCCGHLPDIYRDNGYCPVCSKDIITTDILLSHLLEKYGLVREQVEEELRYKDAGQSCCECQKGGELLICDRCQRGFHFECLDIDKSSIDWEKPWFCGICALINQNQ